MNGANAAGVPSVSDSVAGTVPETGACWPEPAGISVVMPESGRFEVDDESPTQICRAPWLLSHCWVVSSQYWNERWSRVMISCLLCARGQHDAVEAAQRAHGLLDAGLAGPAPT